MMSIISKLIKVRDALITLDCDVHHYTKGIKKSNKYIVWMENGHGNILSLDNKNDEQSIVGTIDLYTKDEFDPIVDSIQETLDNNDISYVLSDVQYEEETDIIHYTWEWEL